MRAVATIVTGAALGALLSVAPVLAQQVDSFHPVPSLTQKKAERQLSRLGFTCQPDPEPLGGGEKAFECGKAGPPQAYTARFVVDTQGHLLSLTAHSIPGTSYSVEEAFRVLVAIASIDYDGARPKDVRQYLWENIAGPLASEHPEKSMYDPKSGHVDNPRPLELGGVVFTIVGMPSSPGFDMSVSGY